jgi:hypothetical protein
MTQIKSYTSWQPLEEVIVGRVYTPDYFDYINNPKVKDQLQKILYETNEDLDNLQKTIEQYGATVKRPGLISIDQFQQLQHKEKKVPLPPLTPRDWQISLGEKLLRVLPMPELNEICADFADQIVNPHGNRWDSNWNADCTLNNASASCIVRVGTDVFFDNSDWLKPDQSQWIVENVLDSRYKIHQALTYGHGDAVFAILKPGVIITSMHDEYIDYNQDFPGWDLCRIRDASIFAALEVGKFKQENFNGAWYIQDQDPTPEFSDYVDRYLGDWVGYISETVFDVNCLVLDEENVIFSAYNKLVFDYCEKHRINPIVCNLRHQYFWDGGISCCTQDLRRRGELETYL